jgi:dTDP-4-dehydrorhamnose 3,5-epimerase
MRLIESTLAGVKLIEPKVFADARGSFFESFNSERFAELGLPDCFTQANVSVSKQGVIRGLHFQNPEAQGKLVYVLHGAVFDVAVDIRLGSPTFGKWFGCELSRDNALMMYIPEGFAHGFQALSESASFCYLCTRVYRAAHDRAIRFNDPQLGVQWPLPAGELSPKDLAAPLLSDLTEALPRY